MSEQVILASGSKSRLALLQGAGVHVQSIKPNVDEDAAKRIYRAENMPIRDQAMALAELKALKVSRASPGLVIGGDQMLNLDEQAFDKPETLDDAKAHLRTLSGKTHRLETAIVICQDGTPVWRHLERPKLFVRPLTEDFISGYVSRCGEALLTTVGAYQLESEGSQLFTRIDGDYFSILGLPLLPLLDFLRTRGVVQS